WVYFLEAAAAQYHDGRFKQAAHRIYNYGINRIQDLDSWGYTGSEAGWSLLDAWAITDDSLGETPREKDVALTQRHTIVQNTDAQQQQTGRHMELFSTWEPDKLVFASGTDKDGLALLLDAVGDADHGHKKPPMTVQLSDHQSVLLMALGYMERLPEDHDRPLVMDFDGYPYDNTVYFNKNTNDTVTGAHVYELGGVGYGTVQMTRYQGYPANFDRDVVFIKNVGVVMKDRVTFTALTGESDIWLRWGSLYRTANVGPDYGNNWINSYLGEWLPVRGSGNPNGAVYAQWHNSKRDLLIYFLPNEAGTMELVDKKQLPDGTNLDSTLPLRWQVQYSIRQTTTANAPVSATTLLLPHSSGPASTLAGGVTVAHDDAQYTVFSFTGEDGALYSVVLNRSGAAVSAGGVATDGQMAYVKCVSGTVTNAALYGGTYLTVNGQNVTALAATAKEQLVPAPLSDVQVSTNPNPPVEVGNPITITATPVGGAMVQYQFQVGYDGGNWTTLQAYASSNTCNWTPTAGHDYTIRVWAKEGDSANQYDVQKDTAFTVTEPQASDLGMVITTPVIMQTGGTWTNNVYN
ncbi:MAG TPA: hypothetical protein VGL77_06070, partial [Armatimonadota bacterium]